jgi:hypothetical protein
MHSGASKRTRGFPILKSGVCDNLFDCYSTSTLQFWREGQGSSSKLVLSGTRKSRRVCVSSLPMCSWAEAWKRSVVAPALVVHLPRRSASRPQKSSPDSRHPSQQLAHIIFHSTIALTFAVTVTATSAPPFALISNSAARPLLRATRSPTQAAALSRIQPPPPLQCQNPSRSQYPHQPTRAQSGPPRSAPSDPATPTPHRSRPSSRSLTATSRFPPPRSASPSQRLQRSSRTCKAQAPVPDRASFTSTKRVGGANTSACA